MKKKKEKRKKHIYCLHLLDIVFIDDLLIYLYVSKLDYIRFDWLDESAL
jgi:hypothetical protein